MARPAGSRRKAGRARRTPTLRAQTPARSRAGGASAPSRPPARRCGQAENASRAGTAAQS
eukprot:4194686-Lingulodinium_polyedra.AAC.1